MSSTPTISLLRRLGAMIYDTVLAGFSVVIVSSIPAVLFQSLTGYRVPDSVMTVGYIFLTYLFYLVLDSRRANVGNAGVENARCHRQRRTVKPTASHITLFVVYRQLGEFGLWFCGVVIR